MKEHNEAVSSGFGLSWSNLLLHILPALRHLPHFPPYVRLMDVVKKREWIWEQMIGPALVNALSSTIVLGTGVSDS